MIRARVIGTMLLLIGCGGMTQHSPMEPAPNCDDPSYPPPSASLYVLPFAIDSAFETGLTNCSSSYHAPRLPDQFAFDFNLPERTPFSAARAGTVYRVVETEASAGGGAGNYVVISHGDGTFALYYHSPRNGISVRVGDQVEQGDVLGVTGSSGLAGYPHLHFIVVQGDPSYPYDGLAISFRNAIPADTVLGSFKEYRAGPR